MGKSRLEAFSDGVIAIILTIMVLELKVPHGHALEDLLPLFPVLLSYVLSFVNVGIYWNNHHHLIHTVKRPTGRILWANLHLLFWLSLVPFTTGWMGENHFASTPTAIYGIVLFMAAVAYLVLQKAIIASHGKDGVLARALGSDWKGTVSVIAYGTAVVAAYCRPWIAWSLYSGVALLWLVPDLRIERAIGSKEE